MSLLLSVALVWLVPMVVGLLVLKRELRKLEKVTEDALRQIEREHGLSLRESEAASRKRASVRPV